MNPLTDYCFTPAPQQTINYTGIKKWLWRLKKILNQKGDPTLICCSYSLCDRQFKPEQAYSAELVYMHGAIIARKKKLYCCKQCAEKDQMAHEL